METSASANYIEEAVSLRQLYPPDVDNVKLLAKHLFPIDYPDSWFADIVSSQRFYTQAALLGNEMVAMLVAEVKPIAIVNKEDCDLLSCQFPPDSKVCYLLSIGVSQPHRRRGLARLLLGNLLSHLHAGLGSQVKCVYLHVLATNRAAIEFYRGQGFQLHCHLPFYYVIEGRPADACSFALYLNDGRPRETCLQLAARTAGAAAGCLCRRLLHGCWRRLAVAFSLPRLSSSSAAASSSASAAAAAAASASRVALMLMLRRQLASSTTSQHQSAESLRSSSASV